MFLFEYERTHLGNIWPLEIFTKNPFLFSAAGSHHLQSSIHLSTNHMFYPRFKSSRIVRSRATIDIRQSQKIKTKIIFGLSDFRRFCLSVFWPWFWLFEFGLWVFGILVIRPIWVPIYIWSMVFSKNFSFGQYDWMNSHSVNMIRTFGIRPRFWLLEFGLFIHYSVIMIQLSKNFSVYSANSYFGSNSVFYVSVWFSQLICCLYILGLSIKTALRV